MAFKTHSGSSSFSLDGVPFTVGEKWKAPKKVTLPMKFETGNPSEFLFLEYDSTLEEALLARFEAERENERAAAAAATARATISVNSNDEGSVNAGGCLELTDSAKALSRVKFQTKDVGQPESTNRNNTAYLTSQTNGNNSQQRSLSRNAAYQMNGNILVPTPIAASGECVLPGTSRVTADKFDLTDFENVQDPFENLSLKVMNDFEELDKVFLASSRLQSEAVGASRQDDGLSDGVHSELLPHSLRGDGARQNEEMVSPRDCSGDVSSSQPEKVDESRQMTSGRNAPEPYLFPSASYAAGYVDSSSKANSSNSSDLPLSNPALYSRNYSESKIPHSILAGNLASSVLSSKHNFQSTGNNYINRVVTPQNIMTSSSPQTDHAGSYVAYGGVPPASLWPTSATGGAAWPTATSDFNNRPLHDLARGHLVHHNFEQFNVTKDSLRSAKSNPDLSAVDESPLNPFVSVGCHTPPIDTRTHLPERFGANLAQSSSTTSTTSGSATVSKSTVTTENTKPFSYEDGLYSTLSDEAQQFVDFIVAMGFPKMQTIRAVQKLGIDEKLVLDHLCAFSKLTEKGYSEKDVEKSLFLFEGDLENAKSYLVSTMTFRAMGFEEDRISKALVECSLDEEKSLDWLTS